MPQPSEHPIPKATNKVQEEFLYALRFKQRMSVVGGGSGDLGATPSEALSHIATVTVVHGLKQIGEPFVIETVRALIPVSRLPAKQRAALEKPFEHMASLIEPERLRQLRLAYDPHRFDGSDPPATES